MSLPDSGGIRWLVHPGLFWIPESVKRGQPFLTSMLARLPWRVITGSLALATGTAAGAAFAIANVLWAVGDLAIGSLDAKTADEPLQAGAVTDEPEWLPASGHGSRKEARRAGLALSRDAKSVPDTLATLPPTARRE